LWDDAEREIHLALRVAVLVEYDVPRATIAERLAVTPTEVKQAIGRLKKISDRIDRSDDF
jgi:hypothetical protein